MRKCTEESVANDFSLSGSASFNKKPLGDCCKVMPAQAVIEDVESKKVHTRAPLGAIPLVLKKLR